MKWRIILILAGILVLGSCQQVCGIPEPPVGMEGAFELAKLVPGEAEWVIYGEELGDLLIGAEKLSEQVPLELPDLGDQQQWEEVGAKVDGPGVVFFMAGQVMVAGWVDPQKGEGVEEGWQRGAERGAVKFGQRRLRGWQEVDEGGQWQRWLATDRRRLVAGFSVREEASPLMKQVWRLDDSSRQSSPGKREFVQAPGEAGCGIYGVIRGESLVRRLGGEGYAEVLRDMLAAQIGEVFFACRRAQGDGEVVVDLWTPGGEGQGIIGELGEAQEQLPDIGGLIRQGVPAVVRLSVEPAQLLSWIKLAIDGEDRERIEEVLRFLREELQVDVEAELLENITGQFALLVYGLEDSFFESQGVELLASVFRLQATREALLIPIKERRRMEDFFNAFTQISQGNLRRQALEHTIQYAWFDDGALKWAVILSDDYLLFVDSSVAFGYALSWERSPASLSAVLQSRGVEELMEGVRGLGAYLDLATLGEVFVQAGERGMGEWLKGLEAVSLESDLGGQRDRARLRLWLARESEPEGDEG